MANRNLCGRIYYLPSDNACLVSHRALHCAASFHRRNWPDLLGRRCRSRCDFDFGAAHRWGLRRAPGRPAVRGPGLFDASRLAKESGGRIRARRCLAFCCGAADHANTRHSLQFRSGGIQTHWRNTVRFHPDFFVRCRRRRNAFSRLRVADINARKYRLAGRRADIGSLRRRAFEKSQRSAWIYLRQHGAGGPVAGGRLSAHAKFVAAFWLALVVELGPGFVTWRSEEHTSELQSPSDLVLRLLLLKKKRSIR